MQYSQNKNNNKNNNRRTHHHHHDHDHECHGHGWDGEFEGHGCRHHHHHHNNQVEGPSNPHGIDPALMEEFSDPHFRIIQRNVIYVIGIVPEIAEHKLLTSDKFFGQYGNITKLFISRTPYHLKFTNDYCYNAYVTYDDPISALLAIVGLDKFMYRGKKLEASYGTNKYCLYFLRGEPCRNKKCNFIHEFAKKEDWLVKKHNVDNKDIFERQKSFAYEQLYEMRHQLYNWKHRKRVGILPSVDSIIKKVEHYFEGSANNSLRSWNQNKNHSSSIRNNQNQRTKPNRDNNKNKNKRKQGKNGKNSKNNNNRLSTRNSFENAQRVEQSSQDRSNNQDSRREVSLVFDQTSPRTSAFRRIKGFYDSTDLNSCVKAPGYGNCRKRGKDSLRVNQMTPKQHIDYLSQKFCVQQMPFGTYGDIEQQKMISKFIQEMQVNPELRALVEGVYNPSVQSGYVGQHGPQHGQFRGSF